MLMSPSIAKLSSALAKVQAEIGHASKDRKNQHLGNQYATLESVIDAIREPFARHGLAFVQAPVPAVEGMGWVAVETVIVCDGEYLMSVCSVQYDAEEIGKDGKPRNSPLTKPQKFGVAVTYLRRYALSAMVGIGADVEDNDGSHHGLHERPAPRTEPKAAPPPKQDPTKTPHDPSWEADRARFCAKISEIGYEYDQVAAWVARVGKTGLRPSQMPQAGRDAVYAMLDKQRPDLGGPGKAD